jgi:outer membrane receptor protein involved in Fe transport
MIGLRYLLVSVGIAVSAPVFSQADDAADEPVEEVVVTGSRIPRGDLTANSPVTSFEGEEFTLDAETNVIRKLQELPAFRPARSPTDGASGVFTGSFADLRGLDRKRTLVLVNGRRWITTISDGGVDISTIPPELIERVDVVTGGASATYGSDAIAGVVNFVLKRDLDGLELSAQYGITERGERTNTRYSITGGTPFGNDRGSFYVHTAWDETDAISANGRSLIDPMVINEGGVLVPDNDSFTANGTAQVDGTRAQFDSNGELFQSPGVVNAFDVAIDGFNEGPYARLQHPAEKVQINAGLTYDITEQVVFSLDAAYIRDDVHTRFDPSLKFLDFVEFAVDNPFLGPLTQSYLAALDAADDNDGFQTIPGLNRRFNELGPRINTNNHDSYFLGGGITVELADDWGLEVFSTWSESVGNLEQHGIHDPRLAQALDVVIGPEGPECRNTFFGKLECVPVNIFGPGTVSPEAADFLTSTAGFTTYNSDLDVQTILTGRLLELPAGPLDVAFGLEWRVTEGAETPDEVGKTGAIDALSIGEFFARLTQREVFAEALVPLISGARFAEYIGLELGVRYTAFDPGDSAWTYKALGEWAPTDNIRFRGGWQRATRAPISFELGAADSLNEQLDFLIGVDPCFTGAPLAGDVRTSCIADGVPAAVADAGALLDPDVIWLFRFLGGDVDPEIANTWTAGVVVRDLFTDALNFSIDYYSIDIEDAIGGLFETHIFDACILSGTSGTDPLCDRTSRNPSTGFINQLDIGFANIGLLETSGIDFGLDYATPIPGILGSDAVLRAELVGTRLQKWEQVFDINDPTSRQACDGLFGDFCGNPYPEWKTRVNLTWHDGPVSANLSWNRISSVTNDALVYDPDSAGRLAVTETGSYDYFDLAGLWRINETFELRVGINNMTDTDPPIVGSEFSNSNTYLNQYDAIGRRYFLGTSIRF